MANLPPIGSLATATVPLASTIVVIGPPVLVAAGLALGVLATALCVRALRARRARRRMRAESPASHSSRSRTMENLAAVALEEVSKHYGGGPEPVAALREVSLRVSAGDFVAILGPSGSGKSTLLNLVAGLDSPSAGRVLVGGRDLAYLGDNARSDLRLREIGFVFQSFNLFPTFTAEENVAWPLELLGVPWREARRRAEEALAQVALPPAAGRRTRAGDPAHPLRHRPRADLRPRRLRGEDAGGRLHACLPKRAARAAVRGGDPARHGRVRRARRGAGAPAHRPSHWRGDEGGLRLLRPQRDRGGADRGGGAERGDPGVVAGAGADRGCGGVRLRRRAGAGAEGPLRVAAGVRGGVAVKRPGPRVGAGQRRCADPGRGRGAIISDGAQAAGGAARSSLCSRSGSYVVPSRRRWYASRSRWRVTATNGDLPPPAARADPRPDRLQRRRLRRLTAVEEHPVRRVHQGRAQRSAALLGDLPIGRHAAALAHARDQSRIGRERLRVREAAHVPHPGVERRLCKRPDSGTVIARAYGLGQRHARRGSPAHPGAGS